MRFCSEAFGSVCSEQLVLEEQVEQLHRAVLDLRVWWRRPARACPPWRWGRRYGHASAQVRAWSKKQEPAVRLVASRGGFCVLV